MSVRQIRTCAALGATYKKSFVSIMASALNSFEIMAQDVELNIDSETQSVGIKSVSNL